MIPEPEEQKKLKDKWAEFSKKAQSGELPQESVECVAVGILNVSNRESEFSSEDAVNIAMSDNIGFDSDWNKTESSWSFNTSRVGSS